MPDSNEPKNETVRITVSPQASLPPSVPAELRDTVRIHSPTRPASNSPPPSEPPSRARAAATTMPAPMATDSSKKEAARITVLPAPPAKPAVEMKKTQPLIDLPQVDTPAATVAVAPQVQRKPILRIDEIPMPLCWALLGASAAILILQIWNYVS
jgi:hypothetical protein